MKNDGGLGFEKAVSLIRESEKSLIVKLFAKWETHIGAKTPAAFYASYLEFVDTASEITSVVRRYNLKCMQCQKKSMLSKWILIEGGDRECFNLKCGECDQLTIHSKKENNQELHNILMLAPINDVFSK